MNQIPQQTAVARLAHEEPKAALTTAPPIAPYFEDGPHNGLAVRQNSNETCGYYTLPGTDGWDPWVCGAGDSCRTIGSHFGCLQTIYTTCYEKTHAACTSGAALDPRIMCCIGDEFPECITGIKTEGNKDDLTAYLCGRGFSTGELIVYDTPVETRTNIMTKSGITTTVEWETTLSTHPSGTGGGSFQTEESDSDSGSHTPVGAIVGGVIAGLALIAFLGFGFWFVRFQKRNAAASAEREAAQIAQIAQTVQANHNPVQYHGQPQFSPPGYYPVAQGSPPPGGDHRIYQDGTIVAQYSPAKPAISPHPPSELPDDNARRPGMPVELQ